MRALNRVTESTGEVLPAGPQITPEVRTPHHAQAGSHDGGFRPPTISRRSVTAMLAAAFAPAAGTAVVLPKVVETAATALAPATPAALPARALPVAEDPELLALGAELEIRLATYRAAAARLAHARVVATRLWPEPPEGILASAGNRHFPGRPLRYPDCYEEETDFEGNQWPEIIAGAGRGADLPRYIARWGLLSLLLDEIRATPDEWETGFELEVIERIKEAERYEDACYDAIEVSQIEERREEAEACVRALYDLANQVVEHPPRTIAGVLIHARALAGYADVDKDGWEVSAPTKAASILGRGLADAVLRVAATSA